MTVRLLLVPLIWGLALSGWSEVVITNPGLTGRESLVYTETMGPETRPYTVIVTSVGSGTDARIEVKSLGADLESTYLLDPRSLVSLSSQTLTRGADATVKRSAEYSNLRPTPAEDDLVVTDMGSLPVVLRGFPWGHVRAARLLYVGNSSLGAGVSFELQVTGRDPIQAGGRVWDCWHAVTGLGGALGFLVPKTDWWFAVEGTHPLVKSVGPVGGPGSPVRTLVLQSYQPDR